MKTYRSLVQDIVHDLDKVYDKIGALRDTASAHEKKIYNDSRGVLSRLLTAWNTFDDHMPDDRAQMEIDGEWPERLK